MLLLNLLFSLICHFISFSSGFRGVFQSLVTKHFPSEKQRREKAPGNKRKRKWAQIFTLSMVE